MLYLIAAIIFTTKKRTGWSVFAWFLTCIYFAFVLYAAAVGMLDEISWLAGWVLLLVSIVISTKKPDDVVINNYYSNAAPEKSSSFKDGITYSSSSGLTGNYSHIYFCPSCHKTFSGSSSLVENCASCGATVRETVISVDEWRSYSPDKKLFMKAEFQNGRYLRGTVTCKPKISEGDDIGEIKKYKELLDAGIITQEEFTAKKKQILGI